MIRFIKARKHRVRLLEERIAELETENSRLELALLTENSRLNLVITDLRVQQMVEEQLWGTIARLVELAEAPIFALVRDGRAVGVYRSREAALDAAQRRDPDRTFSWQPAAPEADLRQGWVITTVRPPALTARERGPVREEVLAWREHLSAVRRQLVEEGLAQEALAIEAPRGGEAVES
ncbi:hypothetical protein [Kitasatospora sp. HPMI-4]|uniref:hypothetical protein n=1 Tax=Kitasatospora sp. HPMI-4 TaxID=3448443 RepID=UPI003F1A07A7